MSTHDYMTTLDKCTNVQMDKCTNVQLYNCTIIQLYNYTNVQMSQNKTISSSGIRSPRVRTYYALNKTKLALISGNQGAEKPILL